MIRRAAPRQAVGRSLTLRVLVGVAVPMLVLAAALTLGGTLVIRTTVDAVNDRILDAAARGIGDSLAVDGGRVTLDLSPTIFAMLENTARDNVYYSVRQGREVLTGYPDLPRLPSDPDGEARFDYRRYLGHEVRIVARRLRLPGVAHPLTVEVAETLDAREADTRRLRTALLALEAALIALALLTLPLAVRWGLLPVRRVRDELDRRTATDLTPLPLTFVPSELTTLVTALNIMLARVDEAVGAMRRFTGDASHQMRTPLSIIRTHVAVLRASPPGSAEAAQSLDDIEAGAVRLTHLIAQLLALARADDAAGAAPRPEPVELTALVAEVVEAHMAAADAAGIVVTVEGGCARAITVPALAVELLSNLFDNAVRHGRAGGAVRVIIADGPSVAVEDDGPGIPAADRERVFTRFARLSPYGNGGGSGLGLSIARALAQAIGATLSLAEGRGGRGLRATVHFPSP